MDHFSTAGARERGRVSEVVREYKRSIKHTTCAAAKMEEKARVRRNSKERVTAVEVNTRLLLVLALVVVDPMCCAKDGAGRGVWRRRVEDAAKKTHKASCLVLSILFPTFPFRV